LSTLHMNINLSISVHFHEQCTDDMSAYQSLQVL